MRKILFAGLIACLLCLDGAAAPNGRIDAVAKALSSAYAAPAATVTVRDIPLPPGFTAMLPECLPALRPWRNAHYREAALAWYPYSAGSFPYAVRADFNGDGAEDVVLAGHNGKAAVVLALVSDGTSYHLVDVRSRVGGRTPARARRWCSKKRGAAIPWAIPRRIRLGR